MNYTKFRIIPYGLDEWHLEGLKITGEVLCVWDKWWFGIPVRRVKTVEEHTWDRVAFQEKTHNLDLEPVPYEYSEILNYPNLRRFYRSFKDKQKWKDLIDRYLEQENEELMLKQRIEFRRLSNPPEEYP